MKKAKALVQVFGVCLALSGQAYSQTFSVYRIGKPQGATRVGTYGLNDKTMVMMYVDGLAGLWSAARGYELFHLDHPEWGAECRSISEDGKVLFEHYDPNIFDFAGYVWTHETDSVRLPRILDSRSVDGYGINQAGQVVGLLSGGIHDGQPFRYSPDGTVDILNGLPDQAWGFGFDINETGEVTGVAAFRRDIRNPQAFFWSEATGTQEIPRFPPTDQTTGLRINDDLAMGGVAFTPDPRAFFYYWQWGLPPKRIPNEDGSGNSHPNDSNGMGHLAGIMSAPSTRNAGYWRPGFPATRNLQFMVDGSGTGWDFYQASGINNKGTISGHGYYNGSPNLEAILLIPHSANIPAGSYKLSGARKDSGNLASLENKDGDVLRVVRFMVPNSREASKVRMTVESTLGAKPLYLWLKVWARCGVTAKQTVELYDFSEGRFDDGKFRASSTDTGPEWGYAECIAKRLATRYTDAKGKVRARITLESPTGIPWAEFDQAQWESVWED